LLVANDRLAWEHLWLRLLELLLLLEERLLLAQAWLHNACGHLADHGLLLLVHHGALLAKQ
jgi:hypothetical protein